MFVNFLEHFLGLDAAVRSDGFVGHGHVVGADGFAARTTKVDRKFFGVIAYDIRDFEAYERLAKSW